MVDEVIGVGNHAESIDPRRAEKADEKKSAKDKSAQAKKTESQGDSLSISSSAKTALDKTRLLNMIKNMPEVREEKVIEAREKIESGEIFTEEVAEKLSDQLDQIL
ncbi:MAG: flagellar biosynthesis anti-sigma factor FlgM [Candidatus Aureabacteria bacterium]|nr:flagellar biosynthesis anti-sigma factor FlgM [Candidatus Auribacterota bacterium]